MKSFHKYMNQEINQVVRQHHNEPWTLNNDDEIDFISTVSAVSLQIMMSEVNFLKFKNQQVNNIFLRINGKYDILIQLVIQLE